MLPCNVIVQDLGGGQIEVAAINPSISMEHVGNPTLKAIAESVTSKLRRVIAEI
jgi:tripartite-type tricarboxylate transporter receptor subunit TctC